MYWVCDDWRKTGAGATTVDDPQLDGLR